MWTVEWFIKGEKFVKTGFKNGEEATNYKRKKWLEKNVEAVQCGYRY